MAGKGKPGPSKGHGGRPRKPAGEGATRKDGYKRRTVGPKGDGKQVYEHRAVAYGGTPPKSSKSAKKGIVDHKDRNKSNNSKSNLRKTTKSKNNKNR
jgi:hypothetical protein